MKINISRDARPQVRTLLFAALLTIVLWFIPFAEFLTYPFRIFVTFIHEGGHALAALLTGNSVASLSVAMNTSGETYTTNGGLLSQVIVSSAGYVGATAYGALLLLLIRRSVQARIVLAGTAVFIFAMTAIYGFLVPLAHGMMSPFTILAGVLIPVGLLAVSRYASPRVASFFVSFLAVQCILNALFDLKTVFFLSSPLGVNAQTDAANMANATGIPAIVWAVMWIAVSFVILSAAMRLYSVNRSHASVQEDLPFEDAPGI
ncbi:MAG: M50 family metallopeptidase [Pyrinomonadaceae bacterium]